MAYHSMLFLSAHITAKWPQCDQESNTDITVFTLIRITIHDEYLRGQRSYFSIMESAAAGKQLSTSHRHKSGAVQLTLARHMPCGQYIKLCHQMLLSECMTMHGSTCTKNSTMNRCTYLQLHKNAT